MIGMGIGAAAGVGIGLASPPDCAAFNPICSRGTEAAGIAIGLGGLGALVGAVFPIGSWREVYPR